MRATHISPEYIYNKVNGTLSMLEKKSFLGSKLLKFDDNINIISENIIYYQQTTNEQINFDIEKTMSPIIYDTVSDKLNNSTLTMDNSQTNTQLNSNTKWDLVIDTKTILVDYLFATLKKYRTFEGVLNTMVMSNDVNSAIKDYINNNLISRYQFDHIDLFIQYNSLYNGGLRFTNTWDQKVELDANLTKTFDKTMDPSTLQLDINFSQSQPSSTYSFNYYYNLYFTKI